ncbi:aromatase/cyclase [Streptomyces sp. NPDC049627]|uniref:aromatase/cyclase n=1 Tax=Streptomyces sp. NPDC049627 TaxID=3365595 RepID=UPI0037AA22FD
MTGGPGLRRVEHTRVVHAPPAPLYDLVADVTLWPAVFGPTVHARRLEGGRDSERIRLWATVNGRVSDWVSRRALDPARLTVGFEQEVSSPPVASMGGEWNFTELSGGRTEVVLKHHFTVVDDEPAAVTWVHEALDRNSAAELAALARIAESGHPPREIVFSFTDTLALTGPAEAAYDFVARADLWPRRLPHVAGVTLTETAPGVQDLRMETATADGSTHTTHSVRVCRRPEWIAYKQVVTPELLLGHSGLWTFGEGPKGPFATASHTVALNPEAVSRVLGADRTTADARQHVRELLGRNSRTTLSYAAGQEAPVR